MMRRSLLTLALAAAIGLPAATAAPATGRAPEVRQTRTLGTPAARQSANAASTATYARREAQAKDLEDFTGGRKHDDVIYVSAGAVVLVVLILILI